MLKWSVNARRPELAAQETTSTFEVHRTRDLPLGRSRKSLGASAQCSDARENTHSPRTPRARQQRRQSLGVMLSQQRKRRSAVFDEQDKENHNSPFVLSPVVKGFGAFRDVSNNTPTSTPTSNNVNSQRRERQPAQYASTLPTFDIEYSPFGLHQKPFLDSYFHQPRYIQPTTEQPLAKKQRTEETPMTPVTHRLQEAPANSTPAKAHSSFKRPRKFFFQSQQQHEGLLRAEEEDATTSADVGDLTLDHMIDAILESARKEPPKKQMKRRFSCNFKLEKPDLRSPFVRSTLKEPVLCESPTYTAGDDPTSDLPDNFFRCSPSVLFPIEEQEPRVDQQVPKPVRLFNEREVKTPDSLAKDSVEVEAEADHMEEKTLGQCVDEGVLRRQNALRRKTSGQNKRGAGRGCVVVGQNLHNRPLNASGWNSCVNSAVR